MKLELSFTSIIIHIFLKEKFEPFEKVLDPVATTVVCIK